MQPQLVRQTVVISFSFTYLFPQCLKISKCINVLVSCHSPITTPQFTYVTALTKQPIRGFPPHSGNQEHYLQWCDTDISLSLGEAASVHRLLSGHSNPFFFKWMVLTPEILQGGVYKISWRGIQQPGIYNSVLFSFWFLGE